MTEAPALPGRARLVGIGLVAVAVLALAVAPTFTKGQPVASLLFGVLAGANAAAGGALLLRPELAGRILDDIGLDRDVATVAAVALLLLDLSAVFGVPLVYALGSIEQALAGQAPTAYDPAVPSLPELVVRRTINMAFWCGPVLLFLAWARDLDLAGIRDDLGLRGGWRDVLEGVGWTVPVYVALTGIAWTVAWLGLGGGGGGTVPWAHALLVSVTAGIGEEVLFRGFLQPRIGLVAQAVWFGVEHAAYLSISSLIGATVAGILFGLAYKRTGSLWAPITAHVLYDVLVLAPI